LNWQLLLWKEAVRPNNWRNMPHSYVMHTKTWDKVRPKSVASCIDKCAIPLFLTPTLPAVTLSFQMDNGAMQPVLHLVTCPKSLIFIPLHWDPMMIIVLC
jgi:hypothetical protein